MHDVSIGRAMTYPSAVLIKACLNGNTGVGAHPAVPLSPEELARDAQRAVAAGAGALHVHARRPDGSETLEPSFCAAVLRALRAACPGVPLGLTTSATAEADLERRLALVQAWTVQPDFVSVNIHEPGSLELCRLLRATGIGIEVGLWSVQAVATFLDSGLAAHCLRVLVEAQEPDPARAVATAHTVDQLLVDARIALPQVHHGEGLATWAVMEAALAGARYSDRARGYHATPRWACRARQCGVGVGGAGRGVGSPPWATAARDA